MNKSSLLSHKLTQMLLGLTLLAMAQISIAQQLEWNKNFNDEEVKPWEEIQAELPPAPKDENLLPFYVGPTATQKFAIDAKSLSIGKDGVVRYTLVAVSPGGAKNISYEGIRCASFEKKIYALGRDDGTWARSRRDQWEGIVRSKVNRQHAALSQDYFCSNLTIMGNEKDMLQRIKSGKTLTDDLLHE
ncbi:CNP1-like family protein [Herminiimonas fonticola]|uniref:CNP1-like family protein n=1 Tax=Herminiimonas fonticola TaxID=303380 RepID=A0A4R6GH60_9BURK|nr:CNP1-like family protein [Herminiimonas fonticola]RBA25147.1 CNP1-like family [Herminiimonas fonticola]TDN94262.1 CNP1-like family protein [Herminiimonas fonticola]